MLFALAPAIAPIIGGWLHAWFGWRSVFVFLAALAAVLWLATALRLPETLPPEKRQPLRPSYLWGAYRNVLGNRQFLALTLAVGFNFAGFFIYVLAAPVFLMRHLGVSETGFAWLFVPSVSGLLVGSWLSGRFAGRWSPRATIARGYAVMALGAVINVGVNLALPPGLPWSVAPLFVYTLGNAIAMPSLTLMALDLYPEKRGMASSCQSFLQSAISTFGAGVLAPMLWISPLTLAFGQFGLLLVGASCFLIERKN
jgi:DHA1 family bicyclomycin/chloramphenicol resistance-like MFS transporter